MIKEYNQAFVSLETMQEYCKSDIAAAEIEKLKMDANAELEKLNEEHQKQQGSFMHGKETELHGKDRERNFKENFDNLVEKTNEKYIQKGEQTLEKNDPSGYKEYHKDRLVERGFQCGYNLSKYDQDIANNIYTTMGLAKENSYSIGMEKGKEQLGIDKEQEKELTKETDKPLDQDWRDMVDQEKNESREKELDKDIENSPEKDSQNMDWREMVEREKDISRTNEQEKNYGKDFHKERD